MKEDSAKQRKRALSKQAISFQNLGDFVSREKWGVDCCYRLSPPNDTIHSQNLSRGGDSSIQHQCLSGKSIDHRRRLLRCLAKQIYVSVVEDVNVAKETPENKVP